MKKLITILTASAVMSTSAMALSKTIPFGTGGPNGNYYSMSQDIVNEEVCGGITKKPIEIESTGGAADNVDGAMKNKYKLFWTSMDVASYVRAKSKKFNDKKFKVVARMHDEQLHVIFPKNWQPKKEEQGMFAKLSNFSKNMFSDNGKQPVAIDINMLRGQDIGSWGGGIIAAEAVNHFFGLGANIHAVPSAHRTNPPIPVIVVGGAPYKPVEQILAGGKHILVSLDAKTMKNKAPFYEDASVTYKINGKMTIVPTVAVPAVIMGKASKRKSRNADMIKLATCIEGNKEFLSEEGANPNWGDVYDKREDEVDWNSFELDEEYLKTFDEEE